MKKCFLLILALLFASSTLNAQYIESTIPNYAVSLFGKSRSKVETSLKEVGFKILSLEEKLQMGYGADAANTTVGFNFETAMGCKVIWPTDGISERKKIMIGPVKYTSYRAMIAEYIDSGFSKFNNEDGDLVYFKQGKSFTYIAMIDYIQENGLFAATTWFARARRE